LSGAAIGRRRNRPDRCFVARCGFQIDHTWSPSRAPLRTSATVSKSDVMFDI
jgi:hypothetical protein